MDYTKVVFTLHSTDLICLTSASGSFREMMAIMEIPTGCL